MAKNDKALTNNRTATTSLDTAGSEDIGAFIQQADIAALQQGVADGTIKAGPQITTLEEGQQITGNLLGWDDVILNDLATGQPKAEPNKAWRVELRHPTTWRRGPLISFIGGAMLDRQLDGFLIDSATGVISTNVPVVIARGRKRDHKGGKQLTEWFAGRREDIAARILAGDKTLVHAP